MADTPVAVTSVTVKAVESWFKTHERLIALVLVLLVGGWLGNRYLNNSATDAAAKAHTAEVAAQAASLQASQAAAAFQTALTVMQAQNAALAATVAKRQQVTEKQVAEVTAPNTTAQKALDDVHSVYGEQIGMTGIIVDNHLAFPIETVQVFSATKIERDADEATIADQNVEIVNDKNVISACQTNVAALEVKNIADGKAADAQIAKLKADGRKSKRNWFIAGFVAGLATRILGKF